MRFRERLPQPSRGDANGAALGLSGSAWAVRYRDFDAEEELYIFREDRRFTARTKISCLYRTAKWQAQGSRFTISAASGADWRVEGTFSQDTITGTTFTNGHRIRWSGRRVVGDVYEFPPGKHDAVLTVKLLTYVYHLDDMYRLARGESFEAIRQEIEVHEEVWERWGGEGPEHACGFVFKVISPQEYAGRWVTAHHDGVLPSGAAMGIAKKGRIYELRIWKSLIGDRSFGICSIDLDLKEIGRQSAEGAGSGLLEPKDAD